MNSVKIISSGRMEKLSLTGIIPVLSMLFESVIAIEMRISIGFKYSPGAVLTVILHGWQVDSITLNENKLLIIQF